MSSFRPSPDHAGAFREALGQFATGVALVTTQTERGPLGMTVNSFTSVSLDPPLVLWCPARVSARHDAFATTTHFAIHVLGASQLDVARRFSRNGEDFSDIDVITGAHDLPLIQDCLARFECETHAVHDGGDHSVVIGHVHRVAQASGTPLTFQNGRFGNFSEIG